MPTRPKRAAILSLFAMLAMPLAGCGLIDDVFKAAAKAGSKTDEAVEAGAVGARAASEGKDARPAGAAGADDTPAVLGKEAAVRTRDGVAEAAIKSDDAGGEDVERKGRE